MDVYRETIWGISPSDRKWFQVLTLVGGTSGSVILTILEFSYRSPSATPNEVAFNILLGIGASFVASGFITWGLLQAKELTMSMADWIREQTRKRRERLLRQGYDMGYSDAQQGKPPQPPGASNRDSQNPSDSNEGGRQED